MPQVKDLPLFEVFGIRIEGTVLFVEIDSPPMNLIGPAMVRDLVKLIEFLDRGEWFRVVVFSSGIKDFFIPHVDMTQVQEYREAAAVLVGEPSLGLLLRRLSQTKAITIAQIDGRVRGGGNEFILACDMRFASREKAVFAQMEAGFGAVPGAGGLQHLTRLIGKGRTMEIITSANDYDADTAERYGWINKALPDSELEPFVYHLAHRIGKFPHHSLILNKERINAITLAGEDDFRKDSELFGVAVKEPETKSRVAALMKIGFQQPGPTELNLGQVLGELSTE